MSSYYLIDLHTNPFANSRILDVMETTSGSTLMSGGCIVRVPDYVGVKDPADFPDLLAKKATGILAYYAGFPYITYDDLTDTTGIDLASGTIKGFFGDRGSVSLSPMTGRFESKKSTLSGAAPSQAFVLWEAYTSTVDNPADALATRTYTEAPASSLTCQVSFDDGGHYYAATDGNVVNTPAMGQGTDFLIRLLNPSSDRVYLGSWAVIY